ncbi:universal stress protein [Curtobacterium ammoniigenes]|uniref:universal stress protein n=1 Tax=Curtobacterium ammoniigenes TaxID=395387 RepID=UPI0009FA36FC|nr:universal stress protein [Curtobacterium ammoniigenes]
MTHSRGPGGLEPERIVVGIDEHDASLRAVDWVEARRLAAGSSVLLVTVSDTLGTDPVVERDRLGAAASRLRSAHEEIPVRFTTRYGAADQELLAAAEGADLLVIGSRRLHRVRSALEGWMPERIPTVSTIPVVVVPEDWQPADGDIIVGVDPETGDGAFRFAAEEARRQHRRLCLLRAWRMPVSAASGALNPVEDPMMHAKRNRRLLTDTEELVHLRFPDLPHRTLLEEGDPGERILAHAGYATLVVIGRRHRTTLGGVFFGSTAHTLITSTSTPVCVVPA